jgi:hypothetical protein
MGCHGILRVVDPAVPTASLSLDDLPLLFCTVDFESAKANRCTERQTFVLR